MPSMRRWVDGALQAWRDRSRRREIVDVRRRVLPEDLQLQLLERIGAERERVLARLEVIDEELEKLDALLADAKRIERAALRPVDAHPARPRVRLDGTRYQTRRVERGVFMATRESVAARRAVRNIRRHMAQFEKERGHRRTELGELRRLEAQVEAGVVTGLLAITERWGLPGLGDQIAKLGRSYPRVYADMFGNPLPETALDAEGKPDLPGRKPPAREGGPVVVEASR